LRHGIKIVINDLNINEVVDDINFIDLKTWLKNKKLQYFTN
jgi:hypothetical protein